MVTEGNKVFETQADINEEIMTVRDISLVEIQMASLAHWYTLQFCHNILMVIRKGVIS